MKKHIIGKILEVTSPEYDTRHYIIEQREIAARSETVCRVAKVVKVSPDTKEVRYHNFGNGPSYDGNVLNEERNQEVW